MDDKKKQELQSRGKEIYDSILIPPELEDIVKKTIESKDRESIDKQYKESHSTISEIMKYIGAAAAVIILSIIIGLNSSETFAKEMSEVPVLGSVAKVFTVRNYTVKKENLTVNADIPNVELETQPQVQEEIPSTVSGNEVQEEIIPAENTVSDNSVSDNNISENENNSKTKVTVSGNDIISVTDGEAEVIDTLTNPSSPMTVSGNEVYVHAASVSDFSIDINKKIENYVQKYISDETERFEEYKKAFFETGGTEAEWNDRKFDIDVSYEVKSQRGAVVSFVITATENWCAASGEKTCYNLDLLNGKNVLLSDLLGPDYAQVANIQIVRQMKERAEANPNYVYWGVTDEGATQGIEGFTTVDANTKFYINAAGNPVILFDKYEVGPGSMGEQEFEIIVQYDFTTD